MGDKPIAEFARFIKKLDVHQLPAPVMEKVKLCILHHISCSFAGSHLPWSKTALDFLSDSVAGGRSTVLPEGIRGPAPYVALVNAVKGHSIIQEDTHFGSTTHLGCIVVPAAFAVGEEASCTGEELVVSIVLGYEVASRIAMSVVDPQFLRTFRASGFFGAFGSCTVAGRILQLEEEQALNALGMTANLTTGLNQWAHEGSDDLYYHNGFAAANGVIAAKLGKRGMNAAKAMLNGDGGLWKGYGKQAYAENMTKGLGETFEIMNVFLKPAPACAATQTLVSIAGKILHDYRPVAAEIEKIEIFTSKQLLEYPGVNFKGPFHNMVQAKMSQAYSVASMMVFGGIRQSNYDQYDHPLVNELASRCEMIENPVYTGRFPTQSSAKIRMIMRDQTIIEAEMDDLVALRSDEVIANFKREAGKFLTESQVQDLLDQIMNVEKISDVNQLTSHFVKS